jgi:uncharacterized protein YndB with AHSA1/START domain
MADESAAADLAARPSLTFTRHLKASPAKVYAAWTEPEKIARWFGRADLKPETMRAVIDARVGGQYRISFDTESEYYEVGGIYREVVENERLVFSWAWHSTPERESLVTVTLAPDGDGTRLTVHHAQLFDGASREGHEQGWLGALDKLEKFVT